MVDLGIEQYRTSCSFNQMVKQSCALFNHFFVINISFRVCFYPLFPQSLVEDRVEIGVDDPHVWFASILE